MRTFRDHGRGYTGIGMVLAVIVLSLWSTFLQAATPADSAVFGVFKQADAGLEHFALLQRTGVTEELDLVIAIGSPKALPADRTPWTWWSEERKIGLFLQQKTRPEWVYLLGSKSGFEDCAARIERVTATDSVISCQGEKSARYPHQKWVYDVRAKILLKQFSYQPFVFHRVFPSADGAVFVGTDTESLVAVRFEPGRDPEFLVLTAAESSEWFRKVQVARGEEENGRRRILYIEPEPFQPLRFGPSGSFRLVKRDRAGQEPLLKIEEESRNQIRPYPLPQSTYDEFAAARPLRVKNGYVRQSTQIEEGIGPWKLEKDKLWFGKSFYDGEGTTGVGGFGYFEVTDRKYHLFAPPEIAGWSVSAIDVGPGAVWMALVQNGEYGGSSGGLLRYDRQSGVYLHIGFPDIGTRLIRVGDKILAATDFGLAVVEGDRVKRHFIDRASDGRLRVAPATR